MLEFVDSDLYFVQDKDNFINVLLQVRSGSVEKSTGSGGPEITGSSSLFLPRFFLVYPRRNNPGGLEAGGQAGGGAGRGGVVPVHRGFEQCRHTQTILKGMYNVYSQLIVPLLLY